MTIILPQPNSRPRPPATVLQGPADADAFRVKVGRYGDRWYTDSLPGCDIAPASEWVGPSVSQVKKAKPFEGADFVAMKRIALDLTGPERTPVPAHYATCYEHFKSVNKLGLNAAGQRGTHVHKMAEQMLYGLPVDTSGPGAHYHGALVDFFDAYQPELIGAEIVFMHRDLHGHGYGGTGDAIIRIEGQTALVDWKSRGEDGDHAAYPEEGAQIAAYARAQYAIAAGAELAHRIAVPQLDVGLIVSIKPDGCRVYPVDLDEAARLWESLHAWWVARLDEKKPIGRPWPTKRARPDLPDAILDLGDPKRLPTVAQATAAFKAAAYKVPEIKAPETPAPAPDDSEDADPASVELLQARFKSQPDLQFVAMKRVAEAAAAAGVPVSVSQRPSVRRFEIARLLMAWAEYVKGDDQGHEVLRNVLGLVGMTDALQPALGIGVCVGSLATDVARRATSIFDQLSAGAALSIDANGTPVLLAA